MAQTSRSSKCAGLSALEKRPHVSQFFEPSTFGMPQPVAFTKTCFWPNWSQWLRDPGPPSVLDYPPLEKLSTVPDFFELSIFGMPQLVAFTRTCFWSHWSGGSEIQVLQVCSTIRPRKRAECFRTFCAKYIWNAPTCSFDQNLFLVELVIVAQNSRSSKCAGLSAPGKKARCFRFSLTQHICDAPTCSFHQNLFLVELVTVAQSSRSSKCARLSAPKKSPHVSFFL